MPDACQVSPLSFSRVILILVVCMCCGSVCVCVCGALSVACVCTYVDTCVRTSDPREEEPAETAPIFAPHTSLSLSLSSCYRISPPFLFSARRISRLQQHPRSLSNSAPCAFVLLLLSFIFLVCTTSGPTSWYVCRFFLVLPFANPTISLQYRDIGHRGISLHPALPEFSGDAVESNILVSKYNASHVISHGAT